MSRSTGPWPFYHWLHWSSRYQFVTAYLINPRFHLILGLSSGKTLLLFYVLGLRVLQTASPCEDRSKKTSYFYTSFFMKEWFLPDFIDFFRSSTVSYVSTTWQEPQKLQLGINAKGPQPLTTRLKIQSTQVTGAAPWAMKLWPSSHGTQSQKSP